MLSSYFADPNWKVDTGGVVVINITNPAAGSNFSYVVPANTRLIPLSFGLTFTTDGNAANRTFNLKYDDGANIFFRTLVTGNLTASKTQSLFLNHGITALVTVDGGITTIPLGTAILLPGYRILSTTGSIQVGDQYSAIYFEAIRQVHL